MPRNDKNSFDPDWEAPQTESELRAKKTLEEHGFSVLHNQKLCGYYPDLRIAGTKILIEIDGGYHSLADQRKKDFTRTKNLEAYGFKILRFTNSQIGDESLLIDRVREALGIRETKKAEIVAIVSSPSDLKKMVETRMKANTIFAIGNKKAKTSRCDHVGNREYKQNNLKAENARLRKEIEKLKRSLS